MDLMATMASRADPVDLLARTPLFGGLDETSRKAVAMEMREAAYEPGQIIFSRGDAGSELHVVTKGRVRLSVLTSDGRELSFAHAEAALDLRGTRCLRRPAPLGGRDRRQ